MSYPKTFTHRENQHAQVVVMNAEQEAALPAEYLPSGAVRAPQAQTGAAANTADTLMLSPEYAAFVAERDKLSADRVALTEGYKAEKALLDADRELFEAEKAAFVAEQSQAKEADKPAKRIKAAD